MLNLREMLRALLNGEKIGSTLFQTKDEYIYLKDDNFYDEKGEICTPALDELINKSYIWEEPEKEFILSETEIKNIIVELLISGGASSQIDWIADEQMKKLRGKNVS